MDYWEGAFEKKSSQKIFGKLIGYKNNISEIMFDELFTDEINVIYKLLKYMKNSLMMIFGEIIFRKWAL